MNDDLRKAVRTMAESPAGKIVMEFLERTYYDCNMDSSELERAAGRRDVVLTLKRLSRGDKK